MKTRLAGIALSLACIILLLTLLAPKGWKNTNSSPQFIDVVTLAEKIKNRENLRLIDLRSEEDFKEFHLPTAANIPLKDWLLVDEWRNEPLVVYSGNDWLARQMWNVIPDTIRENTFILYGGAHDWYDKLLYPTLPIQPEKKDSLLAEKVHKLCNFYGGFAEFEENEALMEYYRKNLKEVKWPKPKRTVGLIRKGC